MSTQPYKSELVIFGEMLTEFGLLQAAIENREATWDADADFGAKFQRARMASIQISTRLDAMVRPGFYGSEMEELILSFNTAIAGLSSAPSNLAIDGTIFNLETSYAKVEEVRKRLDDDAARRAKSPDAATDSKESGSNSYQQEVTRLFGELRELIKDKSGLNKQELKRVLSDVQRLEHVLVGKVVLDNAVETAGELDAVSKRIHLALPEDLRVRFIEVLREVAVVGSAGFTLVERIIAAFA
jgi:hypothetical protein